MLTYFPTPYPQEWWYSVLCRYHIRTGNHNHQTTIKELFRGKPRAAMGTLFPNSSVYQVISQLPDPWDCRSIVMNHTLFPYYVRMYSIEQKEKMLDTLCNGESVTLTHIWRATTKKSWTLKYCPVCAKEDSQKYGEPYWHRAHQLPLSTVCCAHHCHLLAAGEPDPRLNEIFYPLSMEDIGYLVEPNQSWCEALSTVVTEYLTLPLEVGPTANHNNLAQTLANEGYGIIKSSGGLSLDAPKLYKDLTVKYGSALIQETFGSEMSASVLNRIIQWNLASPERYALLQDFVGLSTSTMFSAVPIEDQLCCRLKDLAKTGITYGKKALAEQLELKPFQLDTLAKRYRIEPFWEQNTISTSTEKKVNMIKLYLTSEERQEIRQAARRLGFRYDNHFVKFCVDKVLQEHEGCPS